MTTAQNDRIQPCGRSTGPPCTSAALQFCFRGDTPAHRRAYTRGEVDGNWQIMEKRTVGG
jgi:hypothetical protein